MIKGLGKRREGEEKEEKREGEREKGTGFTIINVTKFLIFSF